jgi:O-antigen chain-terminating methyltransferase
MGSNTFYFDPTHRNPLPGPLTQYLLEARGLSRTRIMPLHPYPDETIERLKECSLQVQHIFKYYFLGPQDYAVIGQKS